MFPHGRGPGPLAFDATHWLGGGAADDPGVPVAELNGEGGLGNQHGDGLMSVDPAEGDLLVTIETSRIPPTMSICHSCIGPGRSNRTYESFGRFRGRARSSPCRCKIRSMVRSDGTTTLSVAHGPGLRSISSRIRRDPHRGCSRRISATATSTASATWPADLCGRCDRSPSPASCPARYRATHRCTVARCTPARAATSTTSAPSRTARTASRRCSTTDKTTSANPGLPSPDAPRKRRTQGGRNQATVADHLAEECRTSVDGGQSASERHQSGVAGIRHI